MQNTYAQKNDTVQIASANTAESVRDNSAQAQSLQRKADLMNASVQRAPEPRPNLTGMPDNLKSGIESLSGYSMDDVRVHYNSDKPATVQALAYTQGTDIHVAPGQEHTLPHEAWHVAQQMAGRVSPTTNINGMPVNDNAGLEHEADVMGEKAVQCKVNNDISVKRKIGGDAVAQRRAYIGIRPLGDTNGRRGFGGKNVGIGNLRINHTHIIVDGAEDGARLIPSEETRHANGISNNIGFHSEQGGLFGDGQTFSENVGNLHYVEREQIFNDNEPSKLVALQVAVHETPIPSRYNLFFCNCQDWVDDVMLKYNSIVRDADYGVPQDPIPTMRIQGVMKRYF
ncbi:MAG: DUF4157 domain-containing protein [Fibrobacter sp.]|nr:DUF4157 domain-containing protein [Fibrobacter sp.]